MKILSFLGNESNRYLLELKESLFIKRDKPSLNKNLILPGVITALSIPNRDNFFLCNFATDMNLNF